MDRHNTPGKRAYFLKGKLLSDDLSIKERERICDEWIHEGELKELILAGKVIATIIPDIESINYGRGVGYDVIEHIPPKEIGEISATSIREQMKKDGKL